MALLCGTDVLDLGGCGTEGNPAVSYNYFEDFYIQRIVTFFQELNIILLQAREVIF